MTVDLFTVVLLLLGISTRKPWVLVISVVAGILMTELFSPFAFGILSLSFLISIMSARTLLSRLDRASWASWLMVFVVGISIHALVFALVNLLAFDVINTTLVLRFLSLLTRELALGSIILAAFFSLKHSVYYLHYAVVEEKII